MEVNSLRSWKLKWALLRLFLFFLFFFSPPPFGRVGVGIFLSSFFTSNYLLFFPNSGSILMNAVTTKVMIQRNITMTKKSR